MLASSAQAIGPGFEGVDGMSNKNPSATKKGPGRYHVQGYKKTKKSLTKKA